VRFAILNPPLVDKQNVNQKRNNLSCVLKVTVGNKSILLTGDIEQGAEQTLLEQAPDILRSALLVVPHHGSLTSSSQAFVQAVSPKYALFPVGLANQYGFPKQAVLKRYEEVGAINLLVSQTGALMFRLKQTDELTPPIQWRDTSRHYWHRQLAFGEKR
jgi:competence protein ComEC